MKKINKLIYVLLAMIIVISSCTVGVCAASTKWVGSWSTSPLKFGLDLGGSVYTDLITARSTVRTVVTPTLSGNVVRFKFSNLYGTKTLSISSVTVAKTGDNDDEIDTSTCTQVTFNGGSKYANIAAGKELYSDPIAFSVNALEKISVSTYYESATYITTAGLSGGVSYIRLGAGDKTEKKSLGAVATKLDIEASTITYHTLPFLINVDVQRSDDAYSVVIIGDSTVTNEAYLFLATKLYKNGITNVGVLNQGIIGNRVLYDGASAIGNLYGESLMSRFDKDALQQAGCKYIIVKEGLNDILHPMTKSMKDSAPYVSTDQIIEGYKTLATKAKKAGKKIYITTRTPYKGYSRDFFMSTSADLEWSQTGQDMLDTLNKWVLNDSSDYYDGGIDLSKLSDPNDRTKLRDSFTLDGAHLSTYGQIAFVDLLPEESYGVSKSLTSVSSIVKIDPYTADTSSSSSEDSDSSSSGIFQSLLSGFNSLMNGGDSDSGISDTLSEAMDTISSVIGDLGSSSDSSANSTGTSSSTGTGANITIDTSSFPQTEDSTQIDTQAVIADIQSDGGNNTSAGGTTAVSNGISTRQIVGVLLLSISGVILIAVALLFLSGKGKPFGRDSLTRAARHLRS